MKVTSLPLNRHAMQSVSTRLAFLGACALIMLALCSIRAHALTKQDFVCDRGRTFYLTWDGWEGHLTLYPDGTGDLLNDESGEYFRVRHVTAKNPQDYIDGLQGPGFPANTAVPSKNHRLVFWVDFHQPREDQPKGEQKFDGYMMTASPGHEYFRGQIIGVTWWRNIPFAFYSLESKCR